VNNQPQSQDGKASTVAETRPSALSSLPPSGPADERVEELAKKVVAKLKELNINFLALDFDLTVLNIHTGGRWGGSAEELSQHIRPFFYHLIQLAVSSGE